MFILFSNTIVVSYMCLREITVVKIASFQEYIYLSLILCYILKSFTNMSLSTANTFLKGKWVHAAVAL